MTTIIEVIDNMIKDFKSEFNAFITKDNLEPIEVFSDSSPNFESRKRQLCISPATAMGTVLENNETIETWYLVADIMLKDKDKVLPYLCALKQFLDIKAYGDVKEGLMAVKGLDGDIYNRCATLITVALYRQDSNYRG